MEKEVKRKMVEFNDALPRIKSQATTVLSSFSRIIQPITDFIRGNPIVSTAAVGVGTTGLSLAASSFIRRRKSRKKISKKKKKRIRKRCKTTPRRRKRKKRRIIRGRGIGTKEIRHSGRRTKGKFKLVSFRTKSGKLVRFKTRK